MKAEDTRCLTVSKKETSYALGHFQKRLGISVETPRRQLMPMSLLSYLSISLRSLRRGRVSQSIKGFLGEFC